MTSQRMLGRIRATLPDCTCTYAPDGSRVQCSTCAALSLVEALDGDGWLRSRPIPARDTTVTNPDEVDDETWDRPQSTPTECPQRLRILANSLSQEEWIGPRQTDIDLLNRAASVVEELLLRPENPRPARRPLEPVADRLRFHHPNITASGYVNEDAAGYQAERNTDDDEDGPVNDLLEPTRERPANLVSSRRLDGSHSPAIDVDTEVVAVPSRTPGHWHLYMPNVRLSTEQYFRLLEVMTECGIVEQAYLDHARERGQTLLRLAPIQAQNASAEAAPMPSEQPASATPWRRRRPAAARRIEAEGSAGPAVESISVTADATALTDEIDRLTARLRVTSSTGTTSSPLPFLGTPSFPFLADALSEITQALPSDQRPEIVRRTGLAASSPLDWRNDDFHRTR